jgi:saccharopine dehydrogenase-like NADP-dependent oxidoreductase
MLKLFLGHDVVVNGLPWRYDMPGTKACVEVGVNGSDVSTEEEQWDFDAVAKDKDLIFIPGVGAAPGITNVKARNAADQMDVTSKSPTAASTHRWKNGEAKQPIIRISPSH